MAYDAWNLAHYDVDRYLKSLPLLLAQMINIADMEEFRIGIFTITELERYRVTG